MESLRLQPPSHISTGVRLLPREPQRSVVAQREPARSRAPRSAMASSLAQETLDTPAAHSLEPIRPVRTAEDFKDPLAQHCPGPRISCHSFGATYLATEVNLAMPSVRCDIADREQVELNRPVISPHVYSRSWLGLAVVGGVADGLPDHGPNDAGGPRHNPAGRVLVLRAATPRASVDLAGGSSLPRSRISTPGRLCRDLLILIVPKAGLEPAHPKARHPKCRVSASSTTPASKSSL